MNPAEFGLTVLRGQLVADGLNPAATREFLALLREHADDYETQAQDATPYRTRLLLQNARQARKDADRIEKTL